MGEPAIGGAKRWKILAPRPRIGVKIRKLYDRHLTRGGRASPRAGDRSIRGVGVVKGRRLALKAQEKMGHNPRRVSHQ
jgi:hypothetical protein